MKDKTWRCDINNAHTLTVFTSETERMPPVRRIGIEIKEGFDGQWAITQHTPEQIEEVIKALGEAVAEIKKKNK